MSGGRYRADWSSSTTLGEVAWDLSRRSYSSGEPGIWPESPRQVVKPMPPPVKMAEADVTPIQETPAEKPRIRVKALSERAELPSPPSLEPLDIDAEVDDFVRRARQAGF